MIERRIRKGHYEYQCNTDGQWYAKLSVHLHRYHRSRCRCLKFCAYTTKTGSVFLRPSVAKRRAA